jgi:ribosomal protein S18 acetylase RimI-like enzyme
MQQIRVEVRITNAPARAFYGRLGYRYLGQIEGYYDRRESAALLRKQLTSSAPGA